jgi:hypothetical protein
MTASAGLGADELSLSSAVALGHTKAAAEQHP